LIVDASAPASGLDGLWLRGNNTSLFGILCNWVQRACVSVLRLACKEGNAMRIFMAFAIMAAAIGLGGCFWHHQAAVVTQPAPPLK